MAILLLSFAVIMQLFTITVTGIGICPNVYELEACKQAVAQKKQELLYARTTVVNISRVDIDMGSSWQYTNSTYNPSVVVVKVENHLDVGCATCTERLTEIQKVINQFMDLNTDETTTTQQCPTSDDIQNCQNILEGLTEELLHVRNASISVQNVSVEMGRTWQYRQSVFNQSYTTVEIVNKGNACKRCAEGMESLLEKLQMAKYQRPATNTTDICTTFQYQPTSCSDVSNFNPKSPSGYYWLRSKNGNVTQVHCLFGAPTESNPAMSCKEIKEQYPTSHSSYYWLRNPEGKAVQAFCDIGTNNKE